MSAKKVYVGLSGGVDSSLSAALLIEQGYDVTGVYMKNWTKDLPGMKCPWADDLADAKRVAVQLGIDFKVFDFQNEYQTKVVDYMIAEYNLGRTPNPDVMCNQEVKFKLFLETALEDGADMIATGHYAKVENRRLTSGTGRPISANDSPTSETQLLMSNDTNKDQTYFLYRITKEALEKTLFPLGELTKPQVREQAKKRGLFTATKKESMGICFVGSVGIREFLSQFVTIKPGAIIDTQTKKEIGQHDGAIFFTLGQRHGLSVGGGLPYYVVGKDMASNKVYVTRDLNNEQLWRKEIQLSDLHWINQPPKPGQKLQARLRHRAPLISAKLKDSKLILTQPQRAIAPGQSAVLYDGDVVLGGGIII